MKRIAVVRVRGTPNVQKEVRETLKMLRLTKPNHVVIIDDRETYMGMLRKVKDFVTFGELNSEIAKRLISKWGRLPGDERIDEDYVKKKTKKSISKFVEDFMKFKHELSDLEIKKVFRLHPPRKGYESIKKGYSQRGALGYRGEEINTLLKRMT
ncbi:MAG: 50S ribosomal protein L30 [Candidatus Methanofastidiosia archaeon]